MKELLTSRAIRETSEEVVRLSERLLFLYKVEEMKVISDDAVSMQKNKITVRITREKK